MKCELIWILSKWKKSSIENIWKIHDKQNKFYVFINFLVIFLYNIYIYINIFIIWLFSFLKILSFQFFRFFEKKYFISFFNMGRKGKYQKNIKSITVAINDKTITITLDSNEKIKFNDDLKLISTNSTNWSKWTTSTN